MKYTLIGGSWIDTIVSICRAVSSAYRKLVSRPPISEASCLLISLSLLAVFWSVANAETLGPEGSSAGRPFDVSNGAITDAVTGPIIINPRQQDESRPNYANAALYDVFFLTYITRSAEGVGTSIAAQPDTAGRDFFLLDRNGLLTKASAPAVGIDNKMLSAFKESHRDANLNIIANSDKDSPSHHITMMPAGSFDLSILEKMTPHPECLTVPEKIRVKWDDEVYDVVLIMPAIYSKQDGVVNYNDSNCVENKIQTRNARFANLSLGDIPFPSSKNLYFHSFNSIYVIPITFFEKKNINLNKVVFSADTFNKAVLEKYHSEVIHKSLSAIREGTKLDFVQSVIDDAMSDLTRGRE